MDYRVGKLICLARVRKGRIEEASLLAEAAADLNLSPSRLRHIFAKEMGLSVGQFIRRSRLELAQYLLESSNLTIKQVAADAGFSDRRDFTREFKRAFGNSPSAYRRRSLATKFFKEHASRATPTGSKRAVSFRQPAFGVARFTPK